MSIIAWIVLGYAIAGAVWVVTVALLEMKKTKKSIELMKAKYKAMQRTSELKVFRPGLGWVPSNRI